MREHRVVLLPGDGIGPEITDVTKNLLDEVARRYSFKLVFDVQDIGGSAIRKFGIPLPESTLEACKKSDAVLMAAIGSPEFDEIEREKRPETGLLRLRAGLGLFANIRPVKIQPALINSSTLKEEYVRGVDLIVVRELTGGIYFGEPKGRIKSSTNERAFNTMTYSKDEVNRIAKVAFELARGRNKKICSVDKANVLEVSQLWREQVEELAKQNKDIKVSHLYVDNASMQLVKNPRQFDVVLTGNLFGDILSDQAAMLTGSIGMLPSASLSKDGPGLFEPVHGSAPDIAGLNMANPIAMILSAAMMLRIGLKEEKGADSLEKAVEKVLNAGVRTIDLSSDSLKEVSCSEMGQEILRAL